jgi:hypothetical protein
MYAVFEDFNDKQEDAAPPAPEDDPPVFGDIGEIREQAWTEGYLTGRQASGGAPAGDWPQTAKLLTSVHDLARTTQRAIEDASLDVADLLVRTVIAATADHWPERLLDRVRLVADRIKPALTVAPEFELRDGQGSVQRFTDLADLSRALEAGASGETVTIRWQRGEATIDRMAYLEDLRDAIIPLSAGRINQHDSRNQT